MRREWEITTRMHSHHRFLRRVKSPKAKEFHRACLRYISLVLGGKEYSMTYTILKRVRIERPLNAEERALMRIWEWWRA